MQAAESIYRARLFEQTERLATTDGLTGLTNHRTFQGRLDEHLAHAQRYGKKLSLILCDIDHFKSVNDTYGHPVGDLMLKAVARTLAKEARATDLVARYGGELPAEVKPFLQATIMFNTEDPQVQEAARKANTSPTEPVPTGWRLTNAVSRVDRVRLRGLRRTGGACGRLLIALGIVTRACDGKSSEDSAESIASATW